MTSTSEVDSFFVDHWDIMHYALTYLRRRPGASKATIDECNACLAQYRKLAYPLVRAAGEKALEYEMYKAQIASIEAEYDDN